MDEESIDGRGTAVIKAVKHYPNSNLVWDELNLVKHYPNTPILSCLRRVKSLGPIGPIIIWSRMSKRWSLKGLSEAKKGAKMEQTEDQIF